jgi:hypothetical protein
MTSLLGFWKYFSPCSLTQVFAPEHTVHTEARVMSLTPTVLYADSLSLPTVHYFKRKLYNTPIKGILLELSIGQK